MVKAWATLFSAIVSFLNSATALKLWKPLSLIMAAQLKEFSPRLTWLSSSPTTAPSWYMRSITGVAILLSILTLTLKRSPG